MNRIHKWLPCFALLGCMWGCAQDSRKSVRMYEYNDGPPLSRTVHQPEEEEADEGEWRMVAPGEMTVTPDK